ncbi:DUF5906 domain-containing protein [Sphingomonas sp. H39-1-10]|uniref:primase-helicase family protein n=1 Tax=Sphingomonas pollutisoli TaxID=3030829 RepID=UPI0023B9BDBA|nr:primase-helicase family protein [Sphingomonas pollutisoli]MDF0488830.1 DUF5906 domain-containing protein [Sphingomonas pollutisoli]
MTENRDASDDFVQYGAPSVRAALDAARFVDPFADVEAAGASRTLKHRDEIGGVSLGDFHAYMPTHSYIFAPSREMWPASSVNALIKPQRLLDKNGNPVKRDGNIVYIPAATWLDKERHVEQMTWAPGESMIIEGRLISDGGWIYRPGCSCFNLYRPPIIKPGNPENAGRWIEHVRKVYPQEADHIIAWLAHRVQRPSEKINHALVLGGAQGIGKDTLIEPAKYAVGAWNFAEVSPQQLIGRFNGFLKSVIMRVSEARDLGEVDRYSFYEHMKTLTAAPPDVLRVDEKHMREYSVFNVVGVIITTNNKTNGIYLPADDRRHYVAWSDLTKDDFDADYWASLYGWYANGGLQDVAAYLLAVDLRSFDAKAPPRKTEAFWAITDANRAPEDAELADALDKLGNPKATTIAAVAGEASCSLSAFLCDKRFSRQVAHRFEAAGYEAIRNPDPKDGYWRVDDRRVPIYARKDLSVRERIDAAKILVANSVRR